MGESTMIFLLAAPNKVARQVPTLLVKMVLCQKQKKKKKSRLLKKPMNFLNHKCPQNKQKQHLKEYNQIGIIYERVERKLRDN